MTEQTSPSTAVSAADAAAISQLLGDYGFHHDERAFDALSEVFAPDARYTMAITGGETIGPRVGRDAIVAQIRDFKNRQTDQRRHIISNIALRQIAPGVVGTRSYVTVLATSGDTITVVTAGVYHDRVIKHGGRWVIAEKLLVLDKGF